MNGQSRFYVGVDLGKRRDHTAVAVVERRKAMNWGMDWVRRAASFREEAVSYHLVHARRLPVGTRYEDAVETVRRVRAGLGRGSEVVVDATGVGDAVVEMLERAVGKVTAVVITGGERARASDGRWMAPKKDLIEVLAVMMERGELKAAADMREREVLEAELRGLRTRRGAEGRERYEAGDGEHDDLVLAVALACWRARGMKPWGDQGRSLGLE